MQLCPETVAFQTPATLPAVRSGALALGSGREATCVSGAVGKAAGLCGAAGGGNCWLLTCPDGTAGKGAGWVFSDWKRVLVQPLAARAASPTARTAVLEFSISLSMDAYPVAPDYAALLKTVMLTKLQPYMVKMRCMRS